MIYGGIEVWLVAGKQGAMAGKQGFEMVASRRSKSNGRDAESFFYAPLLSKNTHQHLRY